MPWKLLFSTIPPRRYGGGWIAFVWALVEIGAVTYVVQEVAIVLGCAINLKTSVTAITLVALGTSLPDTFASKLAAEQSPYADNAVGNVTGSNAVNVFLGMGLPWMISTLYQYNKDGNPSYVPAGDLSFSVIVFLCCSMVCFLVLLLRRCFVHGELGGPKNTRNASALILVGLWLTYVTLCWIKAYRPMAFSPAGAVTPGELAGF
jgi:solute carrier family 8 (sodium/calcium exchanger)